MWPLLFGNFVIGTGVMVVPGTLNEISSNLSVSVATAGQLIDGFHGLEGEWRWTLSRFTVALRTPPGASEKGAVLTLHFVMPEVLLKAVSVVREHAHELFAAERSACSAAKRAAPPAKAAD